MAKPKVLIIDDDEGIRTQMKWALVNDYEVFLAGDGDAAMDILAAERPALITLDLGLPPHPEDVSVGLNLLGDILNNGADVKVIVATGNPDKAAALRAVTRGACDFLTKPIDIDELRVILKRALYIHSLEQEYRNLQRGLDAQAFGEIVGSSEGIQRIFSVVRKVATTDVPVLVTGESGTGKELVARAVHAGSSRRGGSFVPINCGAIPENLMESELFGHEKGAFTGAHVQRAGKIELAKGGTLFLDEIGELALPLQVKLLRFLQDHMIEKVGGREATLIDARVIAATNRKLDALVKDGLFREDLYFRLAVVTVEVPPLRERGEDVVLLAKWFLNKYSKDGSGPKYLGPDAVDALNSYDWPGNVRELENRIRRAVTLADGRVITAADLGFAGPGAMGQTLDLKEARRNLEKRVIGMAITKHGGNVSKAAEELGLARPTLHHLIRKYGIKSRDLA
jgi:two-component system NtrC family response regulator